MNKMFCKIWRTEELTGQAFQTKKRHVTVEHQIRLEKRKEKVVEVVVLNNFTGIVSL